MLKNTNILKKSIQEFTAITGQKPLITKSKKAIAGFKIRENMELGLTVTLRGEKMYAFLTKLIFFTIIDLIVLSNLENSKSEIRRLIKGNGVKINNETVNDEKLVVEEKFFQSNINKNKRILSRKN